jgi:hypothetical protein
LAEPKAGLSKRSDVAVLSGLAPKHRPKPSRYLLADVIAEYLKASKETKRSWRDDVALGEGLD